MPDWSLSSWIPLLVLPSRSAATRLPLHSTVESPSRSSPPESSYLTGQRTERPRSTILCLGLRLLTCLIEF
uniref:Secreted protein n=1 Tax=Leersia perrieri TaxID=77586 RepID=A0A0D9VVX5_9ORYZ